MSSTKQMEWENNELWRIVCKNFRTFKLYDDAEGEEKDQIKKLLEDSKIETDELDQAIHKWKVMGQRYMKELYHRFDDKLIEDPELRAKSNRTIDERLYNNNSWMLHYKDNDFQKPSFDLNRHIHGNRSYFKSLDKNDEFSFWIGFHHLANPSKNKNDKDLGKCYFLASFNFQADHEHLPFSLNQKQKMEKDRILDPKNGYVEDIAEYLNIGGRKYIAGKEDPSKKSFDLDTGEKVIQKLLEVIYILAGTIDEYR